MYVCAGDTPEERGEKQPMKINKQDSLFHWGELLIRFTYLKVADARSAVHFKVLCVCV